MIFVHCHTVCPGRVRITSIETTCHSITIQWISPLDENDIPYKVRFKFSYKEQCKTEADSIVVPSTYTRRTFQNLPSDVPVKFSLAAINKRLKAGPSVHTTIRTKKLC